MRVPAAQRGGVQGEIRRAQRDPFPGDRQDVAVRIGESGLALFAWPRPHNAEAKLQKLNKVAAKPQQLNRFLPASAFVRQAGLDLDVAALGAPVCRKRNHLA